MQDFPPRVRTFVSGDGSPAEADPDTRSPGAFLRWMLAQQWKVIALSTLSSLLWFLPMTLGPWIFGVGIVFSGWTKRSMPFSAIIICSARRPI